MLEILSRVPARSVGRFRTVSKLYHHLLSQPSFIKDHLRHINEISSFKLILHLLINSASKLRNCYFCYHLDNNYLTSDTYEAEVNDSSNQIVDNRCVSLHSCNGLFCIEDVYTGLLTLWNPTTREVTSVLPLKHAPKRICIREESNTICSHYYYFGHDSLNDDYKIVCVVSVSKKEGRFPHFAETPMKNTIYIYSHKSGCWKEIEQAFPTYCINYKRDDCTFVHGKIHWVAYGFRDKEGTKHSQCIVSFDLATARYGTVARPPSDHPRDDLNVCVFGGMLCFYINCELRGFEMWIMREYGVEQSWFQLLSIPNRNLQYSQDINHNRRCVPLFLLKSGEILLQAFEDGRFGYGEYRICIYLYNPKNNNFINVKTVRGGYISGHIYVESLVKTSISNEGQSCSGRHSPQSHLQDKDGMF